MTRAAPHGPTALDDACIERFGPDVFAKNRVIVLMQLGRHDETRRELARMAAAHPEDAALVGALRGWDGPPPPDAASP